MKAISTLIIAFMTCVITMAQQTQELIKLKDGTEVRGIITEEIYGKSITIRTDDNQLHTYNIEDVEVKRLIEIAPTSQHSGPKRGYRAFILGGLGPCCGEYGSGKMELSTTHGYQFNPHLFIGGGIATQVLFDYDVDDISIYEETRYDIREGKWSPFASLRLGYSMNDINDGFYLSAMFGFRLAARLNMSLGYDASVHKITVFDWDIHDLHVHNKTGWIGAILFRIGIDLGAR